MKRNRTIFVAAAAALIVSAAGWSVLQSSAAAPVAPAAADQTLGMALMSATVDITESPALIRGSGAVSVSGAGTGFVDVVFDRDLSNCSCTASAGRNRVNNYVSLVTASANCPYVASSVRVITSTHAGAFTNAPFHLIVFCPK